MGRTVPTFTLSLERELSGWSQYRRALRKEDQAVFDQLFAHARRHLAESAAAARPVPFDAMVLSMLIEQQKEIARLRAQVNGEQAPEKFPEEATQEQSDMFAEEAPLPTRFPGDPEWPGRRWKSGKRNAESGE